VLSVPKIQPLSYSERDRASCFPEDWLYWFWINAHARLPPSAGSGDAGSELAVNLNGAQPPHQVSTGNAGPEMMCPDRDWS
jgi:hypothetical protein